MAHAERAALSRAEAMIPTRRDDSSIAHKKSDKTQNSHKIRSSRRDRPRRLARAQLHTPTMPPNP